MNTEDFFFEMRAHEVSVDGRMSDRSCTNDK
jgi:hypothetical protein